MRLSGENYGDFLFWQRYRQDNLKILPNIKESKNSGQSVRNICLNAKLSSQENKGPLQRPKIKEPKNQSRKYKLIMYRHLGFRGLG